MLNKTINGTLNLEGGYLKYEMAGEGMPLILSHPELVAGQTSRLP